MTWILPTKVIQVLGGLIGFKYCRWHNKACLSLKCIEVLKRENLLRVGVSSMSLKRLHHKPLPPISYGMEFIIHIHHFSYLLGRIGGWNEPRSELSFVLNILRFLAARFRLLSNVAQNSVE